MIDQLSRSIFSLRHHHFVAKISTHWADHLNRMLLVATLAESCLVVNARLLVLVDVVSVLLLLFYVWHDHRLLIGNSGSRFLRFQILINVIKIVILLTWGVCSHERSSLDFEGPSEKLMQLFICIV